METGPEVMPGGLASRAQGDCLQALRLGTRGSALALQQASTIAGRLASMVAPRSVQTFEIQTRGDRQAEDSLQRIGAEGVFTKEI